MSWDNSDKKIGFYQSNYKKSLMSAKQNIELYLYNNYIQGQCLLIRDDDINNEYLREFKIDMDNIISVDVFIYNGNESVRIVCKNTAIVTEKLDTILVLPNLKDCKAIADRILAIRDNILNKKREEYFRIEADRKEKEQRVLLENEEKKNFYKNIYDFHITDTNRPTYIFKDENYQCALLYIGVNKNLNFLVIDAVNKLESNGVIEYDKVHYYEKAGAIHYTANIDAHATSFGGSFTGGTFSKKAAFWGGLLLGPMGMAGGTLFTHKPAKYEAPNYDFEVKSSIEKIDDRNVILNYFSDAHHQYIDIELPADIYNFLQTHIAEKKHDIVLEVEKQSALQGKIGVVSLDNKNHLKQDYEINKNSNTNSMNEFKDKVEKLKFMKESGLLSQEEFESEKKKLMSMI